jgi:hypothetical protein
MRTCSARISLRRRVRVQVQDKHTLPTQEDGGGVRTQPTKRDYSLPEDDLHYQKKDKTHITKSPTNGMTVISCSMGSMYFWFSSYLLSLIHYKDNMSR